MKLRFTLSARLELQLIGDWIARDNPKRAVTFVAELEQHCLTLVAMPRAHPMMPGHEARGIRRAVHGHYLIFYRIDADGLLVLHVIHGAQQWERWLIEDQG